MPVLTGDQWMAIMFAGCFGLANLWFTVYALKRVWPFDGNHSTVVIIQTGLMFLAGVILLAGREFTLDPEKKYEFLVMGALFCVFGGCMHFCFTLPQVLRAEHLRRRQQQQESLSTVP